MSGKLDQFLKQKYLNLETYKKSGQAVQTPVWFVISEDLIYVVTRESTGKVKRIKNNPQIRIVPCNFSGQPTGEWLSALAEPANQQESQKAIALRKKKYGLLASIAGIMTSAKGKLVVYRIIIK
jgi:PPOX class probable F420-dependent enzyme